MASLYRVSLKTGRRSISLELYSSSLANIETFCQNNLYAEISKIEKIEYKALSSKVYPVDDPSLYKPVTYFNVRSNEGLSDVIALHTIKAGRGIDEVFADMQTYLKINDTSSIDAHIGITQSQK